MNIFRFSVGSEAKRVAVRCVFAIGVVCWANFAQPQLETPQRFGLSETKWIRSAPCMGSSSGKDINMASVDELVNGNVARGEIQMVGVSRKVRWQGVFMVYKYTLGLPPTQ